MDEALARARREIDDIDAQLVSLLSSRARIAMEIGKLKGKDGQPFFTPEREREVFEKLDHDNPGPLQTRQLVAIFREIISAARAAEKPLTAAYWGPAGTFTHLAAMKTFGQSSHFTPADSIEQVFEIVEHGTADYGVVPIENSVAGIVPETLDVFPHTPLKICAECFLPIRHELASSASSLAEIKRVYAGPQPVRQCRTWLARHLPGVEIVDVAPTAKATLTAKSDPQGAAICNSTAAELAGLPLLVEAIEDNPHNQTRFLIVGFNEPARTGKDKTSLMFNLGNRPGELVAALTAFRDHDVNLTMIESRRVGAFDYNFFMDCGGHRTDEPMRAALATLAELTHTVTILGSYPAAL